MCVILNMFQITEKIQRHVVNKVLIRKRVDLRNTGGQVASYMNREGIQGVWRCRFSDS
jgi:hypothetical protein